MNRNFVFIFSAFLLLVTAYWLCKWRNAASEYFVKTERVQGIMLDTTKLISKDVPQKDTLWSYVSEEETVPFLGKPQELMAYAERKHIRKFATVLDQGKIFYVHLKASENVSLSSRKGFERNVIKGTHCEGWVRIYAEGARWIGDTLVYSGGLVMQTDPTGVQKCVYTAF